MNFKFKLSRRLAMSHPMLLTATLIAVGCETVPLTPDISLVQMLTQPQQVTLEPNDTQQFTALGITAAGDTIVTDVTWSATGGTILPSGLFQATDVDGDYDVVATSADQAELTSTSSVKVLTPLSKLVITPSTANLPPGAYQQFAAYGRRRGDSVAVSVTFAATGGSIDANGLYTAGSTEGASAVIATHTQEYKNRNTFKTATADVVIESPPSLSQVVVTPPSAQLRPSEKQQFRSYGRMSNGDSVDVVVTFAATGGTITTSGLFTAGPSEGDYEVTATEGGGSLSDTATVTVTSSPTLTAVVLAPGNVSLQAGESQQFTAYGRLGNGDSVDVAVTFTATGGTITSGGLYTAGSTAGGYTVIATENGGPLADTATVTITSAPTLAAVVLTPGTVTLQDGKTQQFAAYGRLSNGDSVDVAVTFTASGGTITPGGLYTAGSTPGDYEVIAAETGGTLADTAAVQISPPPPPPGAGADPNLLPLAVANQLPASTAYNALNVPSKKSGYSYADPVTGVTVYKISDPNTPISNNSIIHSYAEFGPHISMPWIDAATGHTMYTLHVVKSPGGDGYFVDFDYDDGSVSGWRAAPWDLLEGGFSSNPSTPRVGYRISDNRFYRVNTATARDENTGNFPSPALPNFSSGTQFLVDANDEWFVAQGCLSCSADHGAAWNAVTGKVWDWGNSAPDEFRIDRGGDWVFLNFDTPTWHQGSLASGPPTANIRTWVSNFANSHGAGAIGYLVGIDPTLSGGPRVFYYDPATHKRTWIGSAGQLGGDHVAAQWVNNNLPGPAQWVLTSAYNAGQSALLYEGVGFFQLNDASASNVRLLAHHYSASDKNEYFSQPHATMSPDGKLVMWGSEMNVSRGRIDIFVARVPAR